MADETQKIWHLTIHGTDHGPMTIAQLWDEINRHLRDERTVPYMHFVVRGDDWYIWPFSVDQRMWNEIASSPGEFLDYLTMEITNARKRD